MNDFYVLLFETSNVLCSVSLISQLNGKQTVIHANHEERSQHTEYLLPMATDLLSQQGIETTDLSAVAFGQGPGGFTGLRVACSVAQGIATALSIPVVPVDNMLAIVMQNAEVTDPAVHLVLQDARMNEVYIAAYRSTGCDWLILQEPTLLARQDIAKWLDINIPIWDMQSSAVWMTHGNAVSEYDGLADEIITYGGVLAPITPSKSLIESLSQIAAANWLEGKTVAPSDAAPLYVRDKVAFTSVERSMGQGGNPKAKDILAPILHKIKLSDAPEIASVERQVQEFPWTLQNFVSGIATGYYGWVARSMGALTGFALLMDAPDMVHLLVLGVHPNNQRQGIGKLLLQQCISHCKQINVSALTLEVRKSNQQAINFYLKNGFEQQGVRTDYYPAKDGREDGLIMTKFVSLE